MNQHFKLQNDKTWKTLLVTDDSLLLVNKSYSSAEEFLEKFQEKGLLKQRLELSVLDISKITHPEKRSNTAAITYSAKNDSKTLPLIFENEDEKEQFVQSLAGKRKFTGEPMQVSVLKAIGPSLIGLAVTAFLTFVVHMDAQIIENGGEVNTSGRRSLFKKLFAWLGEQLGTQGTLIAGGVIALICLYFVYRNLQSRPVEIVYS